MKKILSNKNNVKLLGRTISIDDTLWCALSATGIEFEFTGKHLELNILGDDNATNKETDVTFLARFAIFVNEKRIIDEQINFSKKCFTVVDEVNVVNATIKVLKLSEAPMSLMGIEELICDDNASIKPVAKLSKSIEFIGDSITCGYGVDAPNELTPFSTATEDPTKAYAYLTAKELGWDYSLVSYSGHGIISGYTEGDEPYIDELVPPFYPLVGHSNGKVNGVNVTNGDWDFSSFSPDYIMINLGTNDDSYCKEYKDRQEHFRDEYVNFIKQVRSYNPSSKIICVLGLMGDRLYPYVEEAVSIYIKVTGDTNICCFPITPQDSSNGYGADYHPSCLSHKLASKAVSDNMRSFL